MEKIDSQRAAQESAKLFELSPPKVFLGLRGGEWRAARSMSRDNNVSLTIPGENQMKRSNSIND